VTAVRDRPSDHAAAADLAVPWDERSMVGAKRGLPWWGAVLLGFCLAILGAFVDQKLQGHLTPLFTICYCVGVIAAICLVQRRGLFGPMVQPPLVLAISVPTVVLLASGLPANAGSLGTMLALGRPLIDSFPMMAIATGVTVLIGFVRMYRERDPNAPVKVKSNKPTAAANRAAGDRLPSERASAGDDADRAAARTRARPAQGQGPQRRSAADGRNAGAPGRRSRAAHEDARPTRMEPLPGSRSARQPQDPGARPRQPQDPGARPNGADRPRRTQGRHGENPPPRHRPWDYDN
jgi:hypothetical protein